MKRKHLLPLIFVKVYLQFIIVISFVAGLLFELEAILKVVESVIIVVYYLATKLINVFALKEPFTAGIFMQSFRLIDSHSLQLWHLNLEVTLIQLM